MDYRYLISSIRSIRGAEILGTVGSPPESYPLFRIKIGEGEKVLLSGAVHGDEPAGLHTLLDFINQINSYSSNFEFTILPCVNPWGLLHNQRGNAQGFNINREFKKHTYSRENKIIVPSLEKYLFTMDFHESWKNASRVPGSSEPEGEDPDKFFLWETCPDKSMRLGTKIIQNVSAAGIEICNWERIYGDKNNSGAIFYPEDCATPCYAEGTSFDTFLARNHTPQAFTIESHRDSPLEERVKANLIALQTVLDAKLL